MKQCVHSMLQIVPATWSQSVSSARRWTSGCDRIEHHLQLRETRLQQKRARAAVRARADEPESILPCPQIVRLHARDAETVGDVRDRAIQPRAALGHGRDLERELREKLRVGTVAGERRDEI